MYTVTKDRVLEKRSKREQNIVPVQLASKMSSTCLSREISECSCRGQRTRYQGPPRESSERGGRAVVVPPRVSVRRWGWMMGETNGERNQGNKRRTTKQVPSSCASVCDAANGLCRAWHPIGKNAAQAKHQRHAVKQGNTFTAVPECMLRTTRNLYCDTPPGTSSVTPKNCL